MNKTILLGALGATLCLYAALKLKNKRNLRRFKVRPSNRSSRKSGYNSYYNKMKTWDIEEFFKYTRMTVPVFEKLLSKIKPLIKRQYRSDSISPEERLVITLQYLSQGTSMPSLACSFHIGLTTVHKIIHETCCALWDTLSPEYLKTPKTKEEWLNISKGFHERWDVPNCLGSLDGKHINIQAPLRDGCNSGIVLLASCDSTYQFTSLHISAYELQSNGVIFQNRILGQRLECIDVESFLPGTSISMPHFFVADEPFPIKSNIITPYPYKNSTQKQRIFNYRLSRARQVIENTFGVLVARWKILKTTIVAKVNNVDNILKAVVVLHNFCQKEFANFEESSIYCPPDFVDTDGEENGGWRIEEQPLQSVGRLSAKVNRRQISSLRDNLANYFCNGDKFIWQDISNDL